MRVFKLVLTATLAFTTAEVCCAVQTETNNNLRELSSDVKKVTTSESRELQHSYECPADCECRQLRPPVVATSAPVASDASFSRRLRLAAPLMVAIVSIQPY